MLKLVSNKIRCKFCGDVIESRSVHDFRRCKCGKCSTDGGLEYAQRSFFTENPEDTYQDLSTYIDENGKIIEAKDADKKDIPLKPIHVEIEKVEAPEEHSAPTLDIPEVTEAVKAEPKPIPVLEHIPVSPPNWGKGKHKYQNDDGTLTDAGKQRYLSKDEE